MSTPNIVLICCDDLGYGDLGCYGAEYDTPNIDRLADEGVRFTDWHANAPVCSPTRASLLTGKYPQRAGVPTNAPQGRPQTDPDIGLPPEETTLVDVISEEGYSTGAFGKWHLGMTEIDDPLAHGFDEFFGFRSGCVDYYSHTMMWLQGRGIPPYHDLWDGRKEAWHNGEYLTELITDRTVEFVQDADGPFFTYVAYNAPHYPMHAPEEYFDRYADLDPERQRQAAMIAGIDDGVGTILDTLEKEGITEETIVIFTSDHGPSREVRNHLDGSDDPYFGGSTGQFRGHKFSLFEGGIRVPGIIRYPAELDRNIVRDGLVASMDIVPTVLDFCGIPAMDEIDGTSVRNALIYEEPMPRDRMYWALGDQRAARDGGWKLVLNGREVNDDPEPVHLANLADNPAETENVAEVRPDVVNQLKRDLEEWYERVTCDCRE